MTIITQYRNRGVNASFEKEVTSQEQYDNNDSFNRLHIADVASVLLKLWQLCLQWTKDVLRDVLHHLFTLSDQTF